ncbi:unnamed protein product [Rotaria sordida]|uniref:eIF3a PCI domain-containing protein n=1 Tax=Rotaria sordida TaxID=392033 RepID=A0A814PES4_9BILA|nr:unnamed protein product [Rotaria sordida]
MKFLKRDEQQCLNARQEATNVLMDIDYLNVLQTFESLLLSAASDKSHQDCTDRDILASCLKFVWESYKQSFSGRPYILQWTKSNADGTKEIQKQLQQLFILSNVQNNHLSYVQGVK